MLITIQQFLLINQPLLGKPRSTFKDRYFLLIIPDTFHPDGSAKSGGPSVLAIELSVFY